jgi:hypothetical protein
VTMVRQKVAGLEVAEAACATGSSRLIASVPKGLRYASTRGG